MGKEENIQSLINIYLPTKLINRHLVDMWSKGVGKWGDN